MMLHVPFLNMIYKWPPEIYILLPLSLQGVTFRCRAIYSQCMCVCDTCNLILLFVIQAKSDFANDSVNKCQNTSF